MGVLTARIPLSMAALLAAGVSCSASKKPGPRAPEGREVTIFVTTELKGQIEPCGCTSDPLGDLARTAHLIKSARAGKRQVVHVDGGSLRFSSVEIAGALLGQEKLRAALLTKTVRELGVDAIGLGPYDLSLGAGAVELPRLAANLAPAGKLPVSKSKLIDAGGAKIGVFGVVAPDLLPKPIQAGPPGPAAAAAIKDLEARGAQVVIGLLHMPRAAAIQLAREVPGMDFAVIGAEAPADPEKVSSEPIRAGDTWLVQPADRGQVVTRLDLTVRGNGAFSDAIGPARARLELADLREGMVELQAKLAAWKADTSADPAFVSRKAAELEQMKARIAALEASPLELPEAGPWFVLEQVRIAKGLPCAADVVKAKQSYDRAAGEANLAAARGIKPREPAAGGSRYVGLEECATCHGKAAKHWKTTVHSRAYETLVKLGKENHLDCIYCHVTAFDEPGGSNLGFNESLRDIQCEVCHGPGEKHVAADGEGHIARTPDKSMCVKCHNEEHSDTFDFEPYLRDVTGEGHGAELRERLGDGATGGQLRRAALEKAGLEIGAGCPK